LRLFAHPRHPPRTLHLKREVVWRPRSWLQSVYRRCLNWPSGAGNALNSQPEEPHVYPPTKSTSPPPLKPTPPSALPPIPLPSTHLPLIRPRQLPPLLAPLLARLHQAQRRKEAGHE